MSETLTEELAFRVGELEIEVSDLKKQRYDMLIELYEAIYGDSWARTESPQEVWDELIKLVEAMRKIYVSHLRQ